MISKKKKERSSSQNYQEIRCQSTKISLANTNLGLDLHSSSPEPVNFFGAQSSLGGHNFCLGGGTSSHLGGTAPEYPPVAQGLLCYIFRKLSSKHTKLKLENHSSVSIVTAFFWCSKLYHHANKMMFVNLSFHYGYRMRWIGIYKLIPKQASLP